VPLKRDDRVKRAEMIKYRAYYKRDTQELKSVKEMMVAVNRTAI